MDHGTTKDSLQKGAKGLIEHSTDKSSQGESSSMRLVPLGEKPHRRAASSYAAGCNRERISVSELTRTVEMARQACDLSRRSLWAKADDRSRLRLTTTACHEASRVALHWHARDPRERSERAGSFSHSPREIRSQTADKPTPPDPKGQTRICSIERLTP